MSTSTVDSQTNSSPSANADAPPLTEADKKIGKSKSLFDNSLPADGANSSSSGEDFHYRPVPVVATVAVFLGLASCLALFMMEGLFIGVIAAIVSVIAIVVILSSSGELSGIPFAVFGLLLAVSFTTVGGTSLYRAYKNELPEGYRRTNFPREISEHQLIVTPNGFVAPEPVKPLIDQKLFLKGYIWDARASNRMPEFVLLKDSGECCMGGDPAPWDNMRAVLPEGKYAKFMSGLVSVWGTLRFVPNPSPAQPAVYVFEVDGMEQAKTSF